MANCAMYDAPPAKLTGKLLLVAEGSFRVNHCWVALFPRFPSAGLKDAIIARMKRCYTSSLQTNAFWTMLSSRLTAAGRTLIAWQLTD